MYGWQRATATHDLTPRYLLVSVSLGGKSISSRRYCENATCIGACIRAQPPAPRARSKTRQRTVFRTIGVCPLFFLSFFLYSPLSRYLLFFLAPGRRPQAIWILIEKPGFMLLCDDRDCSREFYYPLAIIHAKYKRAIVLAVRAR